MCVECGFGNYRIFSCHWLKNLRIWWFPPSPPIDWRISAFFSRDWSTNVIPPPPRYGLKNFTSLSFYRLVKSWNFFCSIRISTNFSISLPDNESQSLTIYELCDLSPSAIGKFCRFFCEPSGKIGWFFSITVRHISHFFPQ